MQPFYTLSSIVPNEGVKQPRCATVFSDELFVMGFVDGTITSYEKNDTNMSDGGNNNNNPTTTTTTPIEFKQIPDTTHKIHNGILYGMTHVPEGHETLTETSLITGGGDKTFKNVLSDGTELLSISPLTNKHAHNQPVEVVTFAPDNKKTLITAGWDGTVKWWLYGECLLSLMYQNLYSTQYCGLGNDGLFVMASANKNITMVKIDYEKLYQYYDEYQANPQMNDNSNNNDSNNNPELTLTEKQAQQRGILTICHHIPNAHDHAVRRVIPLYNPKQQQQQQTTGQQDRPERFASIGNDGVCKIWLIQNNTNDNNIPTFTCEYTIDVIRGDQNQSEFLYDIVQLNNNPEETDDILVAIACDDKTVRILNITAVLNGNTNLLTKNLLESPTLIGDDIRLRYHSPYEITCFQTPHTPRTLFTIPNINALLVVTAGGGFILTSNTQQYAKLDVLEQYNNILNVSIEKSKKMSEIDLDQLPTAETLFVPGTQDGQHKVINLNGKPMVVMWSTSKYEWELIGEALGAKPGSNTENNGNGDGNPNNGGDISLKKEHLGKYYDQIVDVDIGGGMMLKLPFNKDDDPLEVAADFLATNHLSNEAMFQVVQFITPYIDQAALKRRKQREEENKKNQVSTLCTTNWSYITRTNVNIKLIRQAIIKRLQEFKDNQQLNLLWPSAITTLNDLEKDIQLNHLCAAAQDAPLLEPSVRINQNDQAILQFVFTKWPVTTLTPFLDVLRALCCEITANTLLFNPSAATLQPNPMNQELFAIINQKLIEIFKNSLTTNFNDKNSFASLSLIFDIYNNVLGKRQNHRTITGFNMMVLYFNTIYSELTTTTVVKKQNDDNNNNIDLKTYLTDPNNTQYGAKLLPQLIKFIYNMTSCCNRMITTSNNDINLINSCADILSKWLMFLLNIYSIILTNNNNILPSLYTVQLFETLHMTCFICNAFKQQNIGQTIGKTYATVIQHLGVALKATFTVPGNTLTRTDQENAVHILNDIRILFGVQQ